ncbi:MAG: ParB/RepB/Spo0J family partition protein [Thermodesulfovibrionales bacterium]|jgi:ParB family chromosome partitioning protein
MGKGIKDLFSRKGEVALKKILHKDEDLPFGGTIRSPEAIEKEKPKNNSPEMTNSNHGQNVLLMPLSDIVPNPFQPRKVFDEEKLAALAESLKDHGILQPIIVRKAGQSTKYELIAGERRLRAAKAAALAEIPAIVKEAEDKDMKVCTLIENLQREDLNVVEKTLGIGALQREIGDTGTTADQLRLTRRSVERYVLIYKVIISSETLLSLFQRSARTIDFRMAEAIANLGRYLKQEEFNKFVDFANKEGIDRAIKEFRRPMSVITGTGRKRQPLSHITKETETHVLFQARYEKRAEVNTEDREKLKRACADFIGRLETSKSE